MVSSRGPEELCPGGDRASVVAKKRGNARGVKGGRKVETLNERMKENSTVNVQWTQFGEEQKQVRKTFDPSPESIGCPGNGRQRLNEPESSGDASADLLESNHQLESRIQEIWPSGSEGGAKLTLSLPLSRFPLLLRGFRTEGPRPIETPALGVISAGGNLHSPFAVWCG